MPVTGDPVGDALRADAEAARAEVRAAGIICPSCGINAADLPRDHMLEMDHGGVDWVKAEKRPATARCAAGAIVPLDDADFETWQAAASVNLLDKVRETEDKAFSEMLGWDIRGETQAALRFTGFLEALKRKRRAPVTSPLSGIFGPQQIRVPPVRKTAVQCCGFTCLAGQAMTWTCPGCQTDHVISAP